MPRREGIKIPGTLHSEELDADANGSDNSFVSDPSDSENVVAAEEGEADYPTDSEEYESDLDPGVPHYPDDVDRHSCHRQERLLLPEELLKRTRRLVRRFADRGQWNNAMRQLVRQTALCVLVYGPQHIEYADSYTQLAKGYLDYKGPNYALQAEEHAEHAKNILLAQESDDQSDQSELERLKFLKLSLVTYHTLGRAQSLLKKFPDAEQSLLKAEKIAQEVSRLSVVKFDFLLETKLKIWTSLAKINGKLGKAAIAVTYYEQAIAVCEKRYGKGALELVPLYQGVGITEQSRPEFPNHEKAIDMYLKAHEIATANAKGQFTVESAGTARALATAYAKCNDAMAQASAESYMQECLTACLQLYGSDHPAVCEAQDELGKLLIRVEKADEGGRLLVENLKAKARVFGDFSPEVLDSYRLLGSLRLSQGRLEKALGDLQRAIDIAEVLYGHGCRVCKELQPTIETILKHPSMEGKQAGYEMKNRPRFNGIVARSSVAKSANGVSAATGVFN